MGKTRRKKRKTHQEVTEEDVNKVPHSFVMHKGEVGKSVLQLEMDIRHVMEPYTATKLKVNKKNVVKDFVHVAGPLGVTHLIMFSKTEMGTYLRFCRIPRGPTLTFKIQQYSLMKDVVSLLKKPKTFGSQFKKPPLLVLNGFSTDSLSMKLMTTMFQNLFPSLNIQKVHLSEIRRCVLLSYNSETKTIDFRHYNIQAAPIGISRGVKKLIQTKLPNMSQLSDISDYVLRGGCGYGSESEGEEPADSRVTLPQDVPGRGNVKAQQSAIRLTELGPRLCLQLIKIQEGMCSGEVLFHEFVKKTAEEIRELKRQKEEKRKLKERRKKQQQENVKKKEKEKALNKARSIEGQMKKQKLEKQDEEADAEGDVAMTADDVMDSDDADWYRQEVGAEPDPELFPKTRKKRNSKEKSQPGKKRRHPDDKAETAEKSSKETKHRKSQQDKKVNKSVKFKVTKKGVKNRGKHVKLKRKSRK
ncbi:hypothetical protein ABFA07_006285 [Porites harrisoni]